MSNTIRKIVCAQVEIVASAHLGQRNAETGWLRSRGEKRAFVGECKGRERWWRRRKRMGQHARATYRLGLELPSHPRCTFCLSPKQKKEGSVLDAVHRTRWLFERSQSARPLLTLFFLRHAHYFPNRPSDSKSLKSP